MAKAKLADRVETIDRFGILDEEIERFAPKVAEHRKLKATIESWYPDPGAAQAIGALFTVQISERKNERTITDPRKAFQLLKKAVGSLDAAIAAITIPLSTAVDKFIPESLHPQFLKKEQTGSRSFKCVRNTPA